MIDIQKTLTLLGIKALNPGASTGITSFGSGEEIVSYSPVDGKLIASTKSTTIKIDKSGTYFVKIFTNEGVVVRKVIIK